MAEGEKGRISTRTKAQRVPVSVESDLSYERMRFERAGELMVGTQYS